MKALIVTILLLVSPLILDSAQLPKKVFVIVSGAGEDRAGVSLLFHFKEAIARSSRYTLDAPPFQSGSRYIVVSFVSVATDSSQMTSAVSLFAQKSNGDCLVTVYHAVYFVGIYKTDEIAQGALASIDAEFSK